MITNTIELETGESYIKDAFDFLEVQYITTSCEIGDIRCGDTVIERKTWDDFVSSMTYKHIINQYMDMDQYPYKFIIISGQLSHINIDKKTQITGMIARLARQGITVITVANDWDLVNTAITILKKSKKLPLDHTIIKRSKNAAKDIIDSAAPRITSKTRDELLKLYGSPLNIALTPIEKLIKAPGCGPTIARRIWENFRADVNENPIPLFKSEYTNQEQIPRNELIWHIEQWTYKNWPKDSSFDISTNKNCLEIMPSSTKDNTKKSI